ncbi:MAG: FAD-binding oxidoreductase [Patescibacteria group bacterium]
MKSEFADAHAAYESKKTKLSASVREGQAARPHDEKLALSGKPSSNLFRTRVQERSTKVNVRDFNHVISVDAENLTAEVEGMTTYEEFVRVALLHGCLPTVVPELKSITLGGAVTGIGIESSSFKFGLVHETVLEIDVLLGDGRVVTCTADNEHRDLFFGFANSYGTLGYALRLKVKLLRAKPFVKLERETFTETTKFLTAIKNACLKAREDGSADYIDGAILPDGKLYLTRGTFVETAPNISDYTEGNIYYKSLATKRTDYVTAEQYIWRWDTDWFWCSRFFGAENPFIRRIVYGKKRLRSTTYWKIRDYCNRHGITKFLEYFRGRSEPVIQDVEIPIDQSEKFLSFFKEKIGIAYVWICPTMQLDPTKAFDLYAMDPNTLYLNFGFWDGVKSEKEDGYYNQLIEEKVKELDGKKSLYSTSYYSRDEFWSLYNKPRYDELKQKYDPSSALKNLYDKCVLRT